MIPPMVLPPVFQELEVRGKVEYEQRVLTVEGGFMLSAGTSGC